MDDDLMSLRDSSSDEDELFSDFADPADLGFDIPETEQESEGAPAWLSELGQLDEPLKEAPTAEARRTAPAQRSSGARVSQGRRKASSQAAAGLTPQQRMILSIFLFLDVAVLGFFILVALGAVNF